MSNIQAQLIYKYNQHCFIDGTFYSAPKSSYQILNIRIHNIKEDRFYTIANAILENKELATYIELFLNLNIYIYNNRENKRNIEPFNTVTNHYDFETGLIGAIKQVWPSSELKLCLWNLYRNIEINLKKKFGDINNHNEDSLNLIKRIKTLVYIAPEYVKDVFKLIEEDADKFCEKEKKFVQSYLKKSI